MWNAWCNLQTQWRTGAMGGERTGLDYAAVCAWLQAQGYSRHSRRRNLPEAVGHVQAMERAALSAWAEQQANTPKRAPPHHG
jgi:hypothetical protein